MAVAGSITSMSSQFDPLRSRRSSFLPDPKKKFTSFVNTSARCGTGSTSRGNTSAFIQPSATKDDTRSGVRVLQSDSNSDAFLQKKRLPDPGLSEKYGSNMNFKKAKRVVNIVKDSIFNIFPINAKIELPIPSKQDRRSLSSDSNDCGTNNGGSDSNNNGGGDGDDGAGNNDGNLNHNNSDGDGLGEIIWELIKHMAVVYVFVSGFLFLVDGIGGDEPGMGCWKHFLKILILVKVYGFALPSFKMYWEEKGKVELNKCWEASLK